VAQEQRQWATAERYYQQALQLKIEFNDRYSQSSTYHQLGTLAEAQEKWHEAINYFCKDLEISTLNLRMNTGPHQNHAQPGPRVAGHPGRRPARARGRHPGRRAGAGAGNAGGRWGYSELRSKRMGSVRSLFHSLSPARGAYGCKIAANS
jgi:tetratricopeptide (TPR) repeat protein